MPAHTWTCQRQTLGVKCKTRNPARLRKCQKCGKRRPDRKRPAHMAALDQSYEVFVEANGGVDACGICGREPNGVRRLHRDHDHRTGKPRGILCFPCNSAIRPYMDSRFLYAAAAYVKRSELREAL